MNYKIPICSMVVLLSATISVNAQSWSITGNVGTNGANNFVGTTDNKPLVFRVQNVRAGYLSGGNVSFGKYALENTTGLDNTAVGAFSLRLTSTGNYNAAMGKYAMGSNTSGGDNVAVGNNALRTNEQGNGITAVGSGALRYSNNNASFAWPGNTAVGYEALMGSATPANNTGIENTAVGDNAMNGNTDGDYNTAVGANALQMNTTGSYLSAFGRGVLDNNTTGGYNTGLGYRALDENTVGSYNVAVGVNALNGNTAGSETVAIGAQAMLNANSSATAFATENTAVGYQALMGSGTSSANTGIRNTAVGHQAMLANSSGDFNTAMGTEALVNNSTGGFLCAIGRSALSVNTTGSLNTGLGYGANVSLGTLTNATAIGYLTTVSASNKVRLGNAAVSTVEGQVAYSWPSDARFKRNVEEDVPGLDLITKLRPVSYTFDRAAFAKHIGEGQGAPADEPASGGAVPEGRTVGFLAQEVESTVKELGYAAFDAVRVPQHAQDNYSLAYAEFVVPLVKAVQELAAKNSELEARNSAMEERLAALEQREGQADAAEVMKAWPVPADDVVRVETPSRLLGKSATLELRDAHGRGMDLQQVPVLGGIVELPLGKHLVAGNYTVVLTVAGEQPAVARIVIAR
ncbi:MAG: tail fiber domain-containing protein [Flavobacteriales bacterium]|nr:tail fiber domain-containing protein [Flavobacteriales bacterium]